LDEGGSHALHRSCEDIAAAPNRFDQLEHRANAFNLAPQSANLHIDASIESGGFSPASQVHQLIPAQDPLWPLGKDKQEVELARGQLDDDASGDNS